MMVGRRLRPERHHGPTPGVPLHPSGLKLRTSHVRRRSLALLRAVRHLVTAQVVSVGKTRVAIAARIRLLRFVDVLVLLETLSDQI